MSEKLKSEEGEISEIPESYQRYLDVIYEVSKNKRGGWVSNKEIAENLNVEPASVSGMLEKLRKFGLIKWEPRKAIRLTDKGKIYTQQLDEIHSLLRIFFQVPQELLKLLGEQQKQLCLIYQNLYH